MYNNLRTFDRIMFYDGRHPDNFLARKICFITLDRGQIKGYVTLVTNLTEVIAEEPRYSRDLIADDRIRHEFSQFLYRVIRVRYAAFLRVAQDSCGTFADYQVRTVGFSGGTGKVSSLLFHSVKLFTKNGANQRRNGRSSPGINRR